MSGRSQLSLENSKVAIIGAGYVGLNIAYALKLRNLAREIALIDVNEKRLRGKHWIFSVAFPIWAFHLYMRGTVG